MNWIYSPLTLEANWVSICRGLLAVMGLVVFIVLLRVKVRECPSLTVRHAILLARFGTITMSLAYWLFIFGKPPALGVPGVPAGLSLVLVLAYVGQAAVLTAIGLAGRNSYWRSDRVETRKAQEIDADAH